MWVLHDSFLLALKQTRFQTYGFQTHSNDIVRPSDVTKKKGFPVNGEVHRLLLGMDFWIVGVACRQQKHVAQIQIVRVIMNDCIFQDRELGHPIDTQYTFSAFYQLSIARVGWKTWCIFSTIRMG